MVLLMDGVENLAINFLSYNSKHNKHL